jgi:phage terminase large subunit-like protein
LSNFGPIKPAQSLDALPSILSVLDLKSGAAWLASEPQQVQETFLNELTKEELAALPYLFRFWALPHQLPPEGDWRSWIVLGGRGAGKTRAGAEWVRTQVEGDLPIDPGLCRAFALVGETIEQARDVMVFGESGILACSPADRRPEWQASFKRLIWPNGAVAQVYSAHDPDRLRGPQFDGAWVDELAKWKKGAQTWDMLQFCLRLGSDPRVCVTTTPRNVPVLKDLMSLPTTIVTSATTRANRANLAKPFLDEVYRRYEGTHLGRQELEGVLITETEGALWSRRMLDQCATDIIPELDRIVVALDPSVSNGSKSDECGLIVAGATLQGAPSEWRAYVLADETLSAASPMAWAKRAVDVFHLHNADRLVAEVNQGGMMVSQVVHQIDPSIAFKVSVVI